MPVIEKRSHSQYWWVRKGLPPEWGLSFMRLSFLWWWVGLLCFGHFVGFRVCTHIKFDPKIMYHECESLYQSMSSSKLQETQVIIYLVKHQWILQWNTCVSGNWNKIKSKCLTFPVSLYKKNCFYSTIDKLLQNLKSSTKTEQQCLRSHINIGINSLMNAPLS